MNRKIAAALGLPEDAAPGEIIRRARGLQNQINAATRVQMNAVAELRRVREDYARLVNAAEPVCANLEGGDESFTVWGDVVKLRAALPKGGAL